MYETLSNCSPFCGTAIVSEPFFMEPVKQVADEFMLILITFEKGKAMREGG